MTKGSNKRRTYDDEFKQQAVQMLLDGHSARSVCDRLGISCPSILNRWKRQQKQQAGPIAVVMDSQIHELQSELRRVERERDILKKALAIFGRHE
ncbi:MAG: transposase [Planctomycetota bacterium]